MAQLKITHLPSDNSGVLSGIRRAIVTTFGRCRGKPYRLEILIKTLEVVILAAKEDLKEIAARDAAKAKVEVTKPEAPATVEVKPEVKPAAKPATKPATKPVKAGDKS